MSTYQLLTNVTAVQSAPTRARGPANPVQAPGAGNPNMPAKTQSFHATLDGVGSCSATVQAVVSNNGSDWSAYGDAVVVTGTSADLAPGQVTWGGNQPWAYFGAYVSAITGTNASLNLKMSA